MTAFVDVLKPEIHRIGDLIERLENAHVVARGLVDDDLKKTATASLALRFYKKGGRSYNINWSIFGIRS